jgi:hypothetical protein
LPSTTLFRGQGGIERRPFERGASARMSLTGLR